MRGELLKLGIQVCKRIIQKYTFSHTYENASVTPK